MTTEEKKVVERLKNDPGFNAKGLTDEEILAKARFYEDGDGLEVYDSVEAYKAAMKKRRDIIEIKE